MSTRVLVYEDELVETLLKELREASAFGAALALITHPGLTLVIEAVRDCLGRGAHAEVLVGVDLPTQPRGSRSLLELQRQFPAQISLKVARPKWSKPHGLTANMVPPERPARSVYSL